jgi:hypothetical protein
MKQVDPYEELNVNAYGVLKPPLLLLLIMLIETWHLWSSVLTLLSGQTWLFHAGLDGSASQWKFHPCWCWFHWARGHPVHTRFFAPSGIEAENC